MKKIRYMIEFNKTPPIIIYTDHFAAIFIFKQITLNITNIDKFNLHFVRVSQYLSSFYLKIRHKTGKSNIVPNILFRLSQQNNDNSLNRFEGVLNALHNRADIPEFSNIYHITLIKMFDDFKNRLRNAYLNNSHWEKFLDLLKSSSKDPIEEKISKFVTNELKRVSGIPFLLREGLIYHVNDDDKWRFCIPVFIERELFEQAHDLFNHGGYHKCRDRLYHTIFIHHFARNLRSYIAHCSKCQLNQIKRHKSYKSLISVTTSAIPFHIIMMDFIIGFPLTVIGSNCLFIIICKFFKRVLLIPDDEIWTISQWTEIIFRNLLQYDWNISHSFINDKDFRFISGFWKKIFTRLRIKFLTFTVYHSQTDK